MLFYFAGECALMAYSFLYQMSTAYDDERSIKAKNAAGGLHWGLNLAALGLFLGRMLQLSQSLVVFLVWFGVGAPMLLAVTKIVNLLIFPALNVEDELYTDAPPPDAVANPVALGAGWTGDPLAHRMRGGSDFQVDNGRFPTAVSPRPPVVAPRPSSVASMTLAAPPRSLTSVLRSPANSAAAYAPVEDVVREAFKKYDADNSGSITKDECVDLITGLGLNVTRQYLEGVWSVYDTNGNGTLDMDEFAIFYVVLQKRSAATDAQEGLVTSPSTVRRQAPTFEMESAGPAPVQHGSANYANYDQLSNQAQFVLSDEAAAAQGLSRTYTSDTRRVHNWGVALVVGALTVSMSQLLSTFMRDCSFEFSVH